jgi:uncharacterized protein with PIN domain
LTPIRFHLDEHVPDAVARGLRRRGIDVTTTDEAGLVGASDIEHVAFALGEGRVIVTHDEDFLKLHAAGVAHSGIVYGHQDLRSIGEVIDFLALLHDCVDVRNMVGKREYL